MPVDIAALVVPHTTALLVNEVQPNTVGGDSALGAAAVKRLPAMVSLVATARRSGVQVIHCVKVFRRDSLARNRNTPIYRRSGVLPSGPVEADPRPLPDSIVHPDLGPDARDLVMTRLHGMGAVTDTGVVPVLRNLGITSVVVIGVSLNVGVPNTAMDLMNHGFEVIIPRDAVAGTPEDYGEQVINHTLKVIATVTTSRALADAWARAPQSIDS
jgi:nicotinamidase-related amidase